jgi:hypothetical protein
MAGWMNQHQQQVVEYLLEEHQVLRDQIGSRACDLATTSGGSRSRPRGLGRTTIITPEILLAWHPKLIAEKYDGSVSRALGRPRTVAEVEALVVRMAEENRNWAYRPIQGTLANLGWEPSSTAFSELAVIAVNTVTSTTN